MAKINKIYYYTKKQKKLNCYSVYITKNDLNKANLIENDELDVIVGKEELQPEQIAQIQNIVSRELSVDAGIIHISTK